MFDYIEENLQKIKNPNDVNIIATRSTDKGFCLVAQLNKGKNIQITQLDKNPTSEPFYLLVSKVAGRGYFNCFSAIGEHIAINKNHLADLLYIDCERFNNKKKRVSMYAGFDDGNFMFLAEPEKEYFFKELKADLEQGFGIKFKDLTEKAIKEKELNQ